MSATIDYNTFGFTFEPGVVSKKGVELRTPAQIPVVTDLAVFIDHFGSDRVTNDINGSSSYTVNAQRIGRDNQGITPDEMRALVYNDMRGSRSARRTVTNTVTVRMLPNGATFTGTTLDEYRAATFAVLHDMGVPNDVARAAIDKITF